MIADGFAQCSVCFCGVSIEPIGFLTNTDVERFTILDDLFGLYDECVEAYGLEKIKSTGSLYVVVGGAPVTDADHAAKCASFSLALMQIMTEFAEKHSDNWRLEQRIGIHCGPVIAGVIGKMKTVYDIWGGTFSVSSLMPSSDTVNTASRMQSTSPPGKIQVTSEFQTETAFRFSYTFRGLTQTKGKGNLDTWFLNSEHSKPNLSPSKIFKTEESQVPLDTQVFYWKEFFSFFQPKMTQGSIELKT
jgi:adenylate cyclase